jgi:CBS domain-containing protein
MATVEDVMVRDVVTIDASATLLEAARLMRDANVGMLPVNVGMLPVMDTGVVTGIITDRDLVVRAMSRDVRPSEVRASECLSEPPRCAKPDWSLDEAMDEMAR